MTRKKFGATIIIASAIAVAAFLSMSMVTTQQTDARQPLPLAGTIEPKAHLGLFDFGPCDANSNRVDARGTVSNPVLVEQGGHTVIHVCGMNQDPSNKTYMLDVHYLGNPHVYSKNASGMAHVVPPFFGGQMQDGLHVTYKGAIFVPAYSQGKTIPDMSHLRTLGDIQTFASTYLHGKKPDVSRFDIGVSADKNATLGVHAFWLVARSPMDPAGSSLNARVIAVKVVP